MATEEFTELDPAISSPPDEGGVAELGATDAPPPTLRETLDAAAAQAREPVDTAVAPQAGDRPRGPDGKFITKDGAPVAAATPDKSPTTSTKAPAAPSTAPAGPPPGWSPEAKAAYATASPAIQAAVIKREQEVSAGFAQYAQAKQALEQVIAPRRQHYASEGISDVQAIDNIWQWFEALKRSPADAFPKLAQMFGYDTSTVAPGADANPQPQTDPGRVAQLEAEVRRLGGTFEEQQTAARRAELAKFSADKPHFEKVRVTMGRLMQAGVATNLDDAYQKATQLDPAVTAEIAAAAEAEADRAAAEAALRRRPASQRQAAVSPRGGASNGAAGSAAPTGIRESLVRGFADARGA